MFTRVFAGHLTPACVTMYGNAAHVRLTSGIDLVYNRQLSSSIDGHPTLWQIKVAAPAILAADNTK